MEGEEGGRGATGTSGVLADCRQILQEVAGRKDRAIIRVKVLAEHHRCVAARSIDGSPCSALGRRSMTCLRVVKSWRPR